KPKSFTDMAISVRKTQTPTIVIYELVWIFKKLRINKVNSIVEDILNNPKIYVIVDDGKISRLALKSGIDLNDGVVLYSAILTNQPLATLDKELIKEAERLNVSVITL
ncbi:MAG: hypothetical protein JZD40_06230, partial [Sulfolobus sp.]|nr:hypothetical protein [Sulfolobus sp.]